MLREAAFCMSGWIEFPIKWPVYIVTSPFMGRAVAVDMCLYVHGRLECRQKRDGEERDKGDFDVSAVSCWPAACSRVSG